MAAPAVSNSKNSGVFMSFSDIWLGQLLRIGFALTVLLCVANGALAQDKSILAPSGELRVALIANSVIAPRDTKGQISGLAVDLAKALATKIGATVKIVPYENLVGFNRSIGKDEWDVAFVARDLSRVSQLAYSDVFLEVDNGYIVRPGLSARTPEEIDRTGIKIGVIQGSPLDGTLTRTIRSAEIVRIPGGFVEAREALSSRRIDAFAENVHVAYRLHAELPGTAVLTSRLSTVRLSIAVPKANISSLTSLNDFLRAAKKDGALAEALKNANLRGVRVPR
jgi:polar amino acid transport system substrate-binding protein